MKKLLAVIFCCITLSLFAQDKPMQFSFITKNDTVGKYELIIKATIAKGAKLLSTNNIEGLDDIKTSIIFDSASKVKLKGGLVTLTTPATEKSAALGDVTIQYFTDSAVWLQEINVVKGDSFRIKGELLSYVLKGDEVLNFSDAISKEFVYKDKTEMVTGVTKEASGKSVLAWLLAGIVAGLIAFLTPCIYSLVPVTVSLFFKKKRKS